MSKIDELLAVLDMPEEEQVEWLCELTNDEDNQFLLKYVDEKEVYSIYTMNIHEDWWQPMAHKMLADLAFRLRDEINQGMMFDDLNCQNKVYRMVLKERAEHPQIPPQDHFAVWWILHSKPIHWIVASLIAKELAKEQIDGKE